MKWFRRAGAARAATRVEVASADAARDSAEVPITADAGACTTCGRPDLPLVGGWDPPICQQCDGAINFDAIEEAEYLH